MRIRENPQFVIGKTLEETRSLNWTECYPIVNENNIIKDIQLCSGEAPKYLYFDEAYECFRFKLDSLQELTGRKSGIVIDYIERKGFICNWSVLIGLPRLTSSGVVNGGPLPKVSEKMDDRLSKYLNSVELTDATNGRNGDIPESGTIYMFGNTLIITPDGWV
jgi:hypothetical protein